MPNTSDITIVLNKDTGTRFEINEQASLADMERACPRFFKNKHGKRETYAVHRGCLIVRNTVAFTHGSERQTTVYIFCELEGSLDMFCVSVGSSVRDIRKAKRLIDKLLDEGVYYYGIDNET